MLLLLLVYVVLFGYVTDASAFCNSNIHFSLVLDFGSVKERYLRSYRAVEMN